MKKRHQLPTLWLFRVVTIAVVLLVARPTTTYPNDLNDLSEEQIEAVRELMEITGAAKIGLMMSKLVVGQMLRAMETTNPDIPDSGLIIVEVVVNDFVEEQLEPGGSYWDLIYPIYYNYFTIEEIKQLVEFYKTPLGAKVTTTMPLMFQEITVAARAWAESLQAELTERLTSRLLKEGY